MENQRIFLFIALGLILVFMWQAWQRDYGPVPLAAPQTAAAPAANSGQSSATDLPANRETVPSASVSSAGTDTPAPAMAVDNSVGDRIRVRTDVLDMVIDTKGGDIRQGYLPTYPVSLDKRDQPFKLLDSSSERLFIAQSGLLSENGAAPDHHAKYGAAESEYRLAEGKDDLEVSLLWQDESGVQVIKIYRFKRGSFDVEMEYQIINNSAQSWTGRAYRQLQHGEVADSGNYGIYTFTGGVIYSEEDKYEKIDFDDFQSSPVNRNITGGWAAVIQHYFLAAWIPAADEQNHYYSKGLSGPRYILGLISPNFSVASGAVASHKSKLYVGPKIQAKLKALAPGLELTVDYGLLTFIAQPLFWLLQKIHGFVGNWGWSIIFLTLIIKLVFYKLSETSYKSMANMRRLGPKLQSMKERYGDDKQRYNAAMMELYKKEKINPLGGCLPILVQIPVFIALYWTLLESVELRQAPFMFWIHDLSTKDPFFVLPLIMGATMFLQQKLNPTPPDPIQAKIMMMLPVVFTVFFLFFPAGLVLYWVVNNVLSIAQQWVITRRIEQAAAKS
jgi:YidC/Oxa1 family membrane protein insertase